MKRKPISKKVRFEIFKRDGHKCAYCGRSSPDVELQVDHIVPVSKGGGNDETNLITSCWDCNIGKGDRELSMAPKPLAEKAAAARKARKAIEKQRDDIAKYHKAVEDMSWQVAVILAPNAFEGFPEQDFNGISGFIEKLGFASVMESAKIAERAKGWYPGSRTRFRYFCGVCWNRVRALQDEH